MYLPSPSILGEKSIREIETTHLTHLPRSLLSPLPTLPNEVPRPSASPSLDRPPSADFPREERRGERENRVTEIGRKRGGGRLGVQLGRGGSGGSGSGGGLVSTRRGLEGRKGGGSHGASLERVREEVADGGGGRRSGDGWRVWREGRAPPVVTRPVPRARVQLHLLPPCV